MAFPKTKAFLRRRKLRKHQVRCDCRVPTRSYGARSGVWTVYDAPLSPGCVIYSFGVGDNIAWDLAMISDHGAEVHAFDPTPRSIEWLSRQQLPAGFHFYEYGLAHFDGEIELFAPKKDYKINYTAYKTKAPTGEGVRCPVRCLETIVSELGHDRIDVLKLDIEGAEMKALPGILSAEIPIGQLLVEFHYNFPDVSFEETVEIINLLRRNGFKIFQISDRGYEFSFVNSKVHVVA